MFKIFKGFLLISIIFNILVIGVSVKGANAYFVWEKYEIEVPAFSNVSDYKDEYVVKLYVNGWESNDLIQLFNLPIPYTLLS